MSLSKRRDQLAKLLSENDLKVVFSESCTAGMVSAILSQCPGISENLCGSAVTYRPETKKQWLWVKANTVKNYSCESEEVADEMAHGALARTKEAEWSTSVVGHFGPGAPEEKDGVIWVGVYRRTARDTLKPMGTTRIQLKTETRIQRQKEATEEVFKTLINTINKKNRP
jgi:nicotinamide-nucleotide amidase